MVCMASAVAMAPRCQVLGIRLQDLQLGAQAKATPGRWAPNHDPGSYWEGEAGTRVGTKGYSCSGLRDHPWRYSGDQCGARDGTGVSHMLGGRLNPSAVSPVCGPFVFLFLLTSLTPAHLPTLRWEVHSQPLGWWHPAGQGPRHSTTGLVPGTETITCLSVASVRESGTR